MIMCCVPVYLEILWQSRLIAKKKTVGRLKSIYCLGSMLGVGLQPAVFCVHIKNSNTELNTQP